MITFIYPTPVNNIKEVCSHVHKKNLIFVTCSDLCIMDEKIFESTFIDIHFENKVLTYGTIYRFPNKDTKSLNKFF